MKVANLPSAIATLQANGSDSYRRRERPGVCSANGTRCPYHSVVARGPTASLAGYPCNQYSRQIGGEMYAITDEERVAGRLDDDKVASIVQDISTQGYAVVADLVSEKSRRLLMTSVLEDAQAIRAKSDLTPHEKHTGIGHLQLGLRRRRPTCVQICSPIR